MTRADSRTRSPPPLTRHYRTHRRSPSDGTAYPHLHHHLPASLHHHHHPKHLTPPRHHPLRDHTDDQPPIAPAHLHHHLLPDTTAPLPRSPHPDRLLTDLATVQDRLNENIHLGPPQHRQTLLQLHAPANVELQWSSHLHHGHPHHHHQWHAHPDNQHHHQSDHHHPITFRLPPLHTQPGLSTPRNPAAPPTTPTFQVPTNLHHMDFPIDHMLAQHSPNHHYLPPPNQTSHPRAPKWRFQT